MSLGGLCQTSYQIEAKFGFHYHSPFDWLVTPLKSIAKIIGNDGKEFCEAIIVRDGGVTPLCANYGVSYAHEFHRGNNAEVIIDRQSMELAGEKLRYKQVVMNELLSGNFKTLFVRLGGHHNKVQSTPYVADGDVCTVGDLNKLCHDIEAKYPTLDFEVAFVYFPEFTNLEFSEPVDHRLRVFELDPDGAVKWRGSVENWSRVLDAYQFDLKPSVGRSRQFSKRRPFEAQELR